MEHADAEQVGWVLLISAHLIKSKNEVLIIRITFMQNIYLGDEYELSPWFKTEIITQEIALQISSNVMLMRLFYF